MKNKLNTKIEEAAELLLSNPFYAINISENLCLPHKTIISEEEFIRVGVKTIKERGPETYLRNLLENLKGNYIK